jgi:hypothetical protein
MSSGTCPPEHALSLPGAKLLPMTSPVRRAIMYRSTLRGCGAAFGLRWQRPQAGDTALDCIGLAIRWLGFRHPKRCGASLPTAVQRWARRSPPPKELRNVSAGACAVDARRKALSHGPPMRWALMLRRSMKERTDRESGHIELLKVSWKSMESPADFPPAVPPSPQKSFDLHPLAPFTPTIASTSDISRAREVFILANNLC